MSENPLILEMREITKEFPGVKALDQVTLKVARGSIHSICGENGAGKSTLMKVLSGVYPYGTYDGQILFEGKETRFKNIKESERAGIVIIHQELTMIPELSVTENIFMGNEITNGKLIDWNEERKRTVALLEKVGLSIDPDTLIKHLGVGQQQLVEIAKALSKNVTLLILDEPTSALNEDDSANLLELMRTLKKSGITCIMISHKLNEIAAISDAVTVIRDGRTVESYEVVAGQVDEDKIIRSMVGRSIDNRYPEHRSNPGETIFEVSDWCVEDPEVEGRMVCKNSSFYVREGEIVGFAGLMGAGRTELMRSIFGRNYGNRKVSGLVALPSGLNITMYLLQEGFITGGITMYRKKVLTLILSATLAMTALSACGSAREGSAPAEAPAANEAAADTSADAKTGNAQDTSEAAPAGAGFEAGATIGISLPWLGTQNWKEAETMFTEQLTEAGYNPIVQAADQKVPQQQQQIESMIENGAKAIVVGPIDGTQLGSVLEQAKAAGVYVIGYDRLIENTEAVDGVVQFGSVRTGVMQGQALLDGLKEKKGEGPYNVELFGGGPLTPMHLISLRELCQCFSLRSMQAIS